MYQPRVQDLNPHKREQFNDVIKMLRKGKIPACLLSPAIIKQHNMAQPEIAHITYADQEVNLDSLAVLYCADGVAVRKDFRDRVINHSAKEDTQQDDLAGLSRRDRHLEMMENINDQS